MPEKRQKQLVSLAISHMNNTYDEMLSHLREEINYENNGYQDDDLAEVAIGGDRIVFAPTVDEFVAVLDRKRGGPKGSRRTCEVLQVALWWAAQDHGLVIYDHPYEGTVEAHVDTHVSVDGVNFRAPTCAELQAVFDEVESFYQYYRWLPRGTIQWDVYGPSPDEDQDGFELIDTVFYDGDCDRDYVRRGLISHDGYDSQIEIIPRKKLHGDLLPS